jgi:hypothetical protein
MWFWRWLAYLVVAARLGLIIVAPAILLWRAVSPSSELSGWKRLLYAVLGLGILTFLVYLFTQIKPSGSSR